jgi:ADP-ribose pyrophosphatase YjhB (NUDIX family)
MRPICVSCGEVVFLNPKVVAAVVVEIDDKVVMVRRRTGVEVGKWSIPAGYVDRGEVLEEAAAREIREEAGLDVEVTGLLGVYSRPADKNVLVVYAGKVVGGRLTAGHEITEVGAFDVEALPPLAFERDAEIIRQWLTDVPSRHNS